MGCHSSKNADARAVSGGFVSDEAPAASSYGVNFSLSLMNITVDKAAKEKYANVAAGYKLTTLKLWSWNDTDLLDALSSAYTAAGLKKLEVMIMVPQDEVIAFADSAEKAKELLPILSRYHFVRSIAVGNEPDLPGGNPPQGKDLDIFQKLPMAVANVQAALQGSPPGSGIVVTVPFSNGVVGPNNGDWGDVIIKQANKKVVEACMPNLDFWAFNPYPYFSFEGVPTGVDKTTWQDWVLGDAKTPFGTPPFSSMLESQLYNMRHALDKLSKSAGSKQIAITETGWPTEPSAVGASIANARLFYQDMRRDLGRMTTTYNLVPGYVFLFELFDEAKKTGNPAEAHWGLLNQDGTPKLGLTEFVLPPSFSATKP